LTITSDFAFLRRLYNAFDPFQPLPVGDSAYVDCNAVRGDDDILQAVGQEIFNTRINKNYSGRNL
jgi:hypothetical protein